MHIILGGTSGLGRAMTQQLRQRGQSVLVLGKGYTPDEDGEGLAVDVYYPDQVQRVVEQLQQLTADQPIEQFVWAAGYGWRGRFEDQSDARAMAEVNFAGPLPLLKWAWRRMSQQSTVANLTVIGSTSSIKPRADEAVYVASKHAQAGLARSLGLQATEQHLPVRVALFLPGAMKTPFWDWRDKPADYDKFNDPTKVASHILAAVEQQYQPYLEWPLPKGTLV